MSNSKDDKLKSIISKSLKNLIEDDSFYINAEKPWNDFEERLKTQKKKTKIKTFSYYMILIIASIILLNTIFAFPLDVTTFQVDIHKWYYENEEDNQILTEQPNQNTSPTVNDRLSFEEAQELTVFHLKYPRYLPNGIKNNPYVEVHLGIEPRATVTMNFEGDFNLSLRQRYIGDNESSNTFIPQNNEIETIELNNTELTVVTSEYGIRVTWIVNLISYTLIINDIPWDEVTNIIKNLK